MKSSPYINDQRREFALYVLQSRAIPVVADGLKAAARRLLWTARDGKKYKSATLAGSTMPIHPHAEASGTVNTLAAPHGNNIPLLTGYGAFGTSLNPTAYGAARYTSVHVSQFTKDVIFQDIEIIPMMENYDSTLQEPVHFLPIIPVVLLNPSEGIAVGFASNILPRGLDDIINTQIRHLRGKSKLKKLIPTFSPSNNRAVTHEVDKNGNTRWSFIGEFSKKTTSLVVVNKLPYGTSHERFVSHLIKLSDNGSIVDFDDYSKDSIDIRVKFKRSELIKYDDDELMKLLNLRLWVTENLNVIAFDGKRVWSPDVNELITKFTDWRLSFYYERYCRLKKLIEVDIQRCNDIIMAIKKNVGGLARKIQSKEELKEFLRGIGVVHVDYIADLPIYRFTEDEKHKVTKKLQDMSDTLDTYNLLLSDETMRVDVYVSELKEVLAKHNSGTYHKS